MVPLHYKGGEFPVRHGRGCGSRGILVSLTGAAPVGLGHRFLLTHNTPILSVQLTSYPLYLF